MATLVPGEKSRMYALGKIARGGAVRGGYVDNRMYITIGGNQIGWDSDNPDVGVLLDTLTITDYLDEAPNTCSFRVNGWAPPEYSPVRITRGSLNAVGPLFAGHSLTVQQFYAGVPRNVQGDVRCVDYTWVLGMKKVTGQYRNQSATAIIQDLVMRGAMVNGVTTNAVVPGLPLIDAITFTNEELPAAITRVCRRIGAYWYIDYNKDVHVFFEDPRTAPPEPLTPTHTSLTHVSALRERTQVLTRVLVEARGSTLLATVAPGDTILPLESVAMFQAAADVFLKVSLSGAESALHLDFTGVVPGGGGSLVGPGQGPTSGPGLSTSAGGAVDLGVHDYAVTWTTAAGETKVSPVARVIAGAVSTPTVAPTVGIHTMLVDPRTAYSWRPGDYVEWAYSYSGGAYTSAGPISPLTGIVAVAGTGHYVGTAEGSNAWGFYVSFTPNGDLTAPYITAWHRVNGGPWIAWNVTIENSSVNQWPQLYAYAPATMAQPATPPSVGPTFQTVTLTGIATGPASVTGRKIYRTKANLAALQLVTTIANNTATTYTDAAADTTLGAAAPVGDTSGLQTPAGTVNPGATSVIVASTGPFNGGGGWALVGEQAIRYTGLGTGALTGVPATGIGAVVGPIQYNTSIRAAPLLTGIPATGTRGLGVELHAGDEVYAVVQVEDRARMEQLAADLGLPEGVREEWISDRRLSISEARARGQATLLSRPITDWSIEYTCRDTRTATGQTLQVNLPAPTSIVGTFRIQQVVWSNFRPRPEQPPTARVTASNRRFSFEDLLRIVKTKE